MRVKTEEKRRAIVAAAKSVFLERGYAAASMAEVSARAGGSKQTLYSYFSSKEDLFIAVMLEEGAGQFDPLFDIFDGGRPLAEALLGFARGFTHLLVGDEALAFRRMIVFEGSRTTLGGLFFEHGPRRGWTMLSAVFEAAMADGRMRRADPWIAVNQFMALCEAGPCQRLLEGAVPSVSEAELETACVAAVDTFVRAYEIAPPTVA